jgi:hypothetical protein
MADSNTFNELRDARVRITSGSNRGSEGVACALVPEQNMGFLGMHAAYVPLEDVGSGQVNLFARDSYEVVEDAATRVGDLEALVGHHVRMLTGPHAGKTGLATTVGRRHENGPTGLTVANTQETGWKYWYAATVLFACDVEPA